MAAPTGTTQTYSRVGIREDLTDIISNIDPVERPFKALMQQLRVTMQLVLLVQQLHA